MPSVAEELAALKQRSLTKNLASKLKDADGLSTPEQEDATIQKTNKTNRASMYKKDAVENLKAGTKAVDQDLAFKQKQIAQKKQDMQKKEEAAKNLKSFKGVAGAPAAMPKQQQKAAKNGSASNSTSSSKETTAPTPAPKPKPAPVKETTTPTPITVTELDDTIVPELDDSTGSDFVDIMDDIPDLVQDAMVPNNTNAAAAAAAASQPYVPPPKRVPNRAEKKAKKTVEKLGMKSVPGIARVTLKMNGNQGFYSIFQPDVYEKNGTYIVFGEAQQGTGAMDQQAQAARAAKMLDTPVPTPTTAAAAAAAAAAAKEDDADVDETGLQAKDIDLVISQAGCSRSKAVTALRENNGDLVNAIMSLTT
ncbi:unnamed protein product [Cylindrotheca closterium]|uniref:NAC-A/B domain-containing protein n=1 Tax=Cylindrotheca closterium TaxID=2856 RepID=A0AAD2JIL9_9STRA|nr:unnamed protein product [Cylindrotheca closterium]